MFQRPRIIPCLSIIDTDLVKTTQFREPRYLGDPVNAVKIFNDKGVDELCVLDIRASVNHEKPRMDYLKDIASEAFMPLSYGGGITTLDEIKEIFHIGYEKVILNTSAFQNNGLIEKAAQAAGSQSIVVSIDYKTEMFGKRNCYISSGTRKVKLTPVQAAKTAENLGAGELLLNAISRDGMMDGYDLHTIREVADAVSIPVIASCGAGKTGDIKAALEEGHAHAVAAGSLFVYYGEEKAVLINFPAEKEFVGEGIFRY